MLAGPTLRARLGVYGAAGTGLSSLVCTPFLGGGDLWIGGSGWRLSGCCRGLNWLSRPCMAAAIGRVVLCSDGRGTSSLGEES